MKYPLLLVLLVFPLAHFAQNDLRVKSGLNEQIEKVFYFDSIKHFTAVKPSFFNDNIELEEPNGLLNRNLVQYTKQGSNSNNSRTLILNPAFVLEGGFQNEDEREVTSYGLGFDLFAKRGDNKWRLGATFLALNSNFMAYQRSFIEQNEVVPGMGVRSGKNRISSNYYSAYLNYNASKYFNFELGYGRQFIGDGYRSLLLSDFSNASPYIKVSTKFWKIRYTNIFASHQNINGVEGKTNLYERKYTATHFLDWQVTKWFNLGLFETIVWQADEGKYRRGFDPNYLNPVIFYRPVEFSVGSSDNALIGANLKFTLPKKHLVYFQTIIDEFLLAEIRADFNQFRNPDDDIRSGWWANKYGVQLGWKKFDWFGLEGLNTRFEYNVVRPFTYAHTNVNQAYSNFNQSLAHPLGANFEEFIGIVNCRFDRILINWHVNYSMQGLSFFGSNLGEDIQASNTTRTQEYENEIKQGILNEVLYLDLSLSYVLQEKWKTMVSVGIINRDQTTGKTGTTNNMMYFSLKTNLYNSYFNF